jgi:UDP-glucose 4-epimerase
MKVLVTGGAGFIGSALVAALGRAGHRVAVYDNLERGQRAYLGPAGAVELFQGDIRDGAAVAQAVSTSRPDAVVHLAALHFIPDCVARPADTLSINVDGTRHVLAACAAAGVGRIAFASSAAVYAPSDEACNEATSALGPHDIYGESKLRGEELCREHHAKLGGDLALLRIFNAVGPRETNPHVVPHLFETLKTSDTIPLGNTQAKRDYIDTRDLALAITAVLERSRGSTPYNIGSGRAYSVDELVAVMSRRLGRPLTIQVDQARLRPVDRPLLLADISKIGAELGWKPAVPLEDTVDRLIEHYGLRIGPALG